MSVLGKNRLRRCSLRGLVLLYRWGLHVLGIQELQMPGQKRDRKGVLGTEIFSQVDVIYNLLHRMTLSEAQKAARIVSMEYQGDKDAGVSVYSDEHENKPGKEVAWDFHDFQDSGHRSTSAFQVIRNLCTK